ncbi:hypothetical protein G6O67_004690 [Ophiocordyceps sinensis]|uniref:DUF676 domain-containing protein n=1 Tax=Ophiocordyceps sinensis TaxID=72228 RepID=A0A8H4PPX8_9HYPO|nr:hypothetical protein G6O67_004690 [Ophiocordyceps sinensis]
MLLLHQTGGVKVGEVVRYTVSYTPSRDKTLPAPDRFHVRIRNTSAATLRAAVLAGPYTLSVCAYPSVFNPFEKLEKPRSNGVPQFEPMVKAGANWKSDLRVPDEIRQAACDADEIRHTACDADEEDDRCRQALDRQEEAVVSWVIEISSQILFTTSAVVGYDVMVASDPDSLKPGMAPSMILGSDAPGTLAEHQSFMRSHGEPSNMSFVGVFSRALSLKVEDTAMLWNSPSLLGGKEPTSHQEQQDEDHVRKRRAAGHDKTKDEARRQKKVHLVIMTHGLHGTMGADMLFLKDSIDGAARQAKLDAQVRRARERGSGHGSGREDDDEDDEDVIVRGYSGNVTKTQRGIKFLGKRVAKYVLSMTYPDQPHLPTGKAVHEGFALGVAGNHHPHHHGPHKYMPHEYRDRPRRSYKMTSISFVGHSLGGPTQTFAIAYIQKHCPSFFDLIRPRNFITLASPLLGVSNEHPFYVRFALESGFVGRSGRDLGLSWGPKTAARSGWGAFVGSRDKAKAYGHGRPESKPLLRVLPTGPAHTALKKFANRTVYANIVNDGIVPLRTSSLLFLDWQSLERVERARRKAGLIESAAAMGWHEMMGNNLVTPTQREWKPSRDSVNYQDEMGKVPQPSNLDMMEGEAPTALTPATALVADAALPSHSGYTANAPLAGLFKLLKANAKDAREEKFISQKHTLMLSRGQTFSLDELPSRDAPGGPKSWPGKGQFRVPPSTSFLEGVGDVLNPAVADVNFLINPSKRPRTVLHDRVYQPTDIPPAPEHGQNGMLVEEKIARSYHRDMSWRKVLVKLEPDAHNNISVRRMFVNSYGWPVVKHLVDTHFSDAAVADANRRGPASLDEGTAEDRTRPLSEETLAQLEVLRQLRRLQVHRPADVALPEPQLHRPSAPQAPRMELDPVAWNETDWLDSGDESQEDESQEDESRLKKDGAKPLDKAHTWHQPRQKPSVNTWGM